MTMNEQQADTGNLSDGLVASPPQPEPNTLPPPPPPQQLVISGERLPYSNAQPVWQFILLNVCTFTLYEYVWWYWNWHVLARYNRLQVNGIGRTIFAPIFSFSFFGQLNRLVSPGYAWSLPPMLLAFFYLVLSQTGGILNRISDTEGIASLTGIALLVRFSTTLPLIPAVQALNAFWAAEQPTQPMRTTLSGGAIVTVIIGGILLLLILLGAVLTLTGQI